MITPHRLGDRFRLTQTCMSGFWSVLDVPAMKTLQR